MSTRSRVLAALWALLLCSTSACAVETSASEDLAQQDDEEGAGVTSAALSAGAPLERSTVAPYIAGGPDDALDALGKWSRGGLRLPSFPRTPVPDPLDGPLEGSPRVPFETRCYQKVITIFDPGASKPIEVVVTVCGGG